MVLKNKHGFTLLELLVTMFIIVLLSSMFLLMSNSQNKKLALTRSAFQLTQDLRWVQEKAMDGVLFDCFGGGTSYFLGVSLEETKDYFIIFADCDSDRARRGNGAEDVRKVFFEKNIAIKSLSPTSRVDLIFAPPEPLVYLNGVLDFNERAIVLENLIDPSATKTVKVNSVGRIEIE